MNSPPDPRVLAFGKAAEAADGSVPAAASSPTRRRLLTLMAALPAADPLAAEANPPRLRNQPVPDPTPRLFAKVQARLAEHERALQICDRLEAELVAEFGYPRVRLPGTESPPGRFAADPESIARHVPPSHRRERLQRVLQRRQALWADAAQACGLVQAQEREEALFRAVRVAADSLHISPATTLTGLMLKLVVLLSLEEPGTAERDTSPWRELRLILIDLDRIVD